jgi:hypothetical protein
MMKKNSVDGDDGDYQEGTAKKEITKKFHPPRCKEKKTQRQQVWHIRGKGELLLLLLLLKGRCREV